MLGTAGCSLLRAEDFSCSLDVLYKGLGISKLQFIIKQYQFFFSCKFFKNFWSSKPWIQIRNAACVRASKKGGGGRFAF
jgi:hypothetical protein